MALQYPAATKKGVVIRQANDTQDLKVFYDILLETARRIIFSFADMNILSGYGSIWWSTVCPDLFSRL
jgi:hypothetical protein